MKIATKKNLIINLISQLVIVLESFAKKKEDFSHNWFSVAILNFPDETGNRFFEPNFLLVITTIKLVNNQIKF